MVGAFDDIEFPSRSVTLPGLARLFLDSDGCHEIERADGSMWPFDDFVTFLTAPARTGSSRMDDLIEHARRLRGREAFVDDVSIVEFSFGPESS